MDDGFLAWLMSDVVWAWTLFGFYLAFTTYLAVRGMQKTKSFSGFALGNGDLGPFLTGITLAAAIASSATFVINPGFVYSAGLSALLHFGVAAYGGVIAGLILFSSGFRRLGQTGKALTLPHWIDARYQSDTLRTYFAIFNLLVAVTFVVLIVKGSALVMQQTLRLDYVPALILIVVFVFSYILLGGTYAHVFTNAFQGGLMVIVAILIFAHGLPLLGGGLGAFFDQLASIDPNLIKPVNPAHPLFNDAFTVFFAGFLVGIGLVAQPHVLTKALYLRSDRDMGRYLAVGIAVCVIYGLVLFAGLYARIEMPELSSQDAVIPIYLAKSFPSWMGIPIAVALLAAGMSTLDGILVSASTIAANDLVLGAVGTKFLGDKTAEEREKLALSASRYILVGMGVAAFLIALNPPKLVGIFAQTGVYGLVAASFAPIAFGILWPSFDRRSALVAAVVGPAVHFGYYFYVKYGLGEIVNPALPATLGIAASLAAGSVAARVAPDTSRRGPST